MKDLIIGMCIGLCGFTIGFGLIHDTTAKELIYIFIIVQSLINAYLVFKTKE